MNKKEFVEKNTGKDKIVGRPIRLNQFKLKVKPNRNYAELLFFGDVHWGHPQCREDKVVKMLQWALKNKVATLLMGDGLKQVSIL